MGKLRQDFDRSDGEGVQARNDMERTIHSNGEGAAEQTTAQDGGGKSFGHVLQRNIRTLVEVRRRSEKSKGLQEKIADAITRFAGSMLFVYIHALIFGSWIAINVGWIPGLPRFDPSFVVLAMFASVEAIFLSTFVLISQNRMTIQADKRAELDLQISLLAEHEVTQIVELLDAIAERLGVEHGKDPSLEESKQDVNPAAVLEAIEHRGRDETSDTRGDGSGTVLTG